jgi:hypothetical protein
MCVRITYFKGKEEIKGDKSILVKGSRWGSGHVYETGKFSYHKRGKDAVGGEARDRKESSTEAMSAAEGDEEELSNEASIEPEDPQANL